MTMWLIRAGKAGEREKLSLENKVAVIGWEELPDLTPCTTREALAALIKTTYPDEKPKRLMNWESQLWPVRDTIKVGDLVVMPLKTRADIVFGRVTGGYQYRSDLAGGPFHTRPVEWVKEFPRSTFDKDLLFSFGAFMTVCRIERNNAEQRVVAVIEGKKWSPKPLQQNGNKNQPLSVAVTGEIDSTDSTALPDIEEQSQDLIRERIAQRFKGHGLATLVAAILEAQGYSARTSPPGADGGVDIMAGCGPLGFDAPRLIVQVKSQDAKVDVKVLRELTGVMGKFHADHALLVGWGGFNQAARAEVATDYFKLRLWDAGDVVKAVQDHYQNLPEGIRADIPLKRVWTLVPDEDAS
jgi:restriction system protein